MEEEEEEAKTSSETLDLVRGAPEQRLPALRWRRRQTSSERVDSFHGAPVSYECFSSLFSERSQGIFVQGWRSNPWPRRRVPPCKMKNHRNSCQPLGWEGQPLHKRGYQCTAVSICIHLKRIQGSRGSCRRGSLKSSSMQTYRVDPS